MSYQSQTPAPPTDLPTKLASSPAAPYSGLSTVHYPWFSETCRQEALAFEEERQLATEQGLHHQVGLIERQIVKLLCMDSAVRTLYLAKVELKFEGPIFAFQENKPVPERKAFWAPGKADTALLEPIEAFQGIIPSAALRARATLEQKGICPQGYWIVTQLHVYQERARMLLAAQFGRHFVSIHGW